MESKARIERIERVPAGLAITLVNISTRSIVQRVELLIMSNVREWEHLKVGDHVDYEFAVAYPANRALTK